MEDERERAKKRAQERECEKDQRAPGIDFDFWDSDDQEDYGDKRESRQTREVSTRFITSSLDSHRGSA